MTRKAGRPREIDPTGEKGGVRTIAVTITNSDYEAIKRLAQSTNTRLSKVVRDAIANHVGTNLSH